MSTLTNSSSIKTKNTNSAVTIIYIQKPIEQVYDYVTDPGNWPLWHPSSISVRGATGHSLQIGEEVTEKFRVAGREGEVVWTVREREAPRQWLIEGQIVNSKEGGTVSYLLSQETGGTLFKRDFTYTRSRLLLRILDKLIIHRRILNESNEALRRLKVRLEEK